MLISARFLPFRQVSGKAVPSSCRLCVPVIRHDKFVVCTFPVERSFSLLEFCWIASGGRKIWKSKDFKSRLHPPQLTSSWKAFLCRMHARVSIKSQVHMNSSFSNPRLLTFFKHFSLGQAQFLSGASYHGIDACFRRLCTYVFRRLASIFFFENPG